MRDTETCTAGRRCECDSRDPSLSWPMHWRPDVAPPAPWSWLDARTGPVPDVVGEPLEQRAVYLPVTRGRVEAARETYAAALAAARASS